MNAQLAGYYNVTHPEGSCRLAAPPSAPVSFPNSKVMDERRRGSMMQSTSNAAGNNRGPFYGAVLFVCAVVALAGTAMPTAQAQSDRYDALANSAMVENRPTPETIKLLKDELLFQRGTQIYLWAMPLLNTLGMKLGSEKAFGAGYNVLPVWKERLDGG
jgi:hypothetical protein